MRALTASITCVLLGTAPTAIGSEPSQVGRLLEGEVMYESLQGDHLDALIKLHKNRPNLSDWNAPNGTSPADLQLNFGLSEQAEKSIAVLSASRRQPARNQAIYQLAWHYYEHDRPMQTLQVLESIQGNRGDVSIDDIQYLRALAFMDVGKFRAAAEILETLPAGRHSSRYIQYNLALSQLQGGNEALGRSTLSSLGSISTSDSDALALRDMANLNLGYRYLQAGELEQARASFNRIRLDGPFTDQALLGSGWAAFTMGEIKRAIVAWSMLHEKSALNESVIEAKMALPYAYSKLGAHGKAANLYAHAIETFESETSTLDASIDAIRNGDLTRALLETFDDPGEEWYVGLSRRLEQQHYYLPLLLSNDEFRHAAGKLYALGAVKRRIDLALTAVDADLEIVRTKQQYYKAVLPDADKGLKAVHADIEQLLARESRQPGSQGRNANAGSDIKRLHSAYEHVRQTRNATAKYSQTLPAYRNQLTELSGRLKQSGQKLNTTIARSAQQMEATAVQILQQKRKQLDGYRSNALFALAESYDFATGKRQ